MPFAFKYNDPSTGTTVTDYAENSKQLREKMWQNKLKPENPTLIIWETNVYPAGAVVPVQKLIYTPRPPGNKKQQEKRKPAPPPLTCGDIWNRYSDLTEEQEALMVLEANQI